MPLKSYWIKNIKEDPTEGVSILEKYFEPVVHKYVVYVEKKGDSFDEQEIMWKFCFTFEPSHLEDSTSFNKEKNKRGKFLFLSGVEGYFLDETSIKDDLESFWKKEKKYK
jgi:hypothetical protein